MANIGGVDALLMPSVLQLRASRQFGTLEDARQRLDNPRAGIDPARLEDVITGPRLPVAPTARHLAA